MEPTPEVNAVKSFQTSVKTAAETGLQKTAAVINEAASGLEKTQVQMKDQMEKALKRAEELAAFNQGTVEAMMKASHIWMNGLQDLSKHVAATAQHQLTETMTTLKTMSGLRSLKDVMDLQTSYTRATVEAAMTETGKLTDATFKLAEEALAPITARVTVAMDTLAKAA